MKIDIEWIKSAKEALIESHIVDAGGNYPKAYKGYISSLGASIIQSGLLPALSIYESDNSENMSSADNNRALLVYAIVLLLKKRDLLKENVSLLLNYAARCTPSAKAELQCNINHALVAIKLAIRIYNPSMETVRSMKLPADEGIANTNTRIINANYQYGPRENFYSNIGWLYYRDFYRDFNRYTYKDNTGKDITTQHEETLFRQKIGTICCSRLQNFLNANEMILQEMSSARGFSSFTLNTTYPGLLIGAGLNHGVKSKGDSKIGFQFDYTTGLPCIPGSSVKGVLRSVFHDSDIKDKEYNESRISYLSSVLENMLPPNSEITTDKILQLGQRLFQENSNKRTIFMDALISHVSVNEYKKDYFMGSDYVTPHKKPLNEPIPIQFLKVLPNVTFTFIFRLCEDSWLTPQQLSELFKEILKDIGIGAKTNVGYGHFQ